MWKEGKEGPPPCMEPARAPGVSCMPSRPAPLTSGVHAVSVLAHVVLVAGVGSDRRPGAVTAVKTVSTKTKVRNSSDLRLSSEAVWSFFLMMWTRGWYLCIELRMICRGRAEPRINGGGEEERTGSTTPLETICFTSCSPVNGESGCTYNLQEEEEEDEEEEWIKSSAVIGREASEVNASVL
ncbi:hypothetical protein EYF80_038549 [Liparis tanakae]|uniref:Uncharacterized protein n=1 Tax=Liparis tanakae TaxID=230148 RepID=A0A4Z2GCY6_9TELE|nr:hypothetical protein EYF80_038549 [Liparis tanakae]